MTMSRFSKASFFVVAALLLVLAPRSGEGTVLKFLEMEHLTEISDLVVLARVESVESGWNDAHSRIRTRVTLEVQRVLLGSLEGEKLDIELPGGEAPGEELRQIIPGVPRFTVGEEAIVFVRNDPDLFCPIVGWIQGKFKVITEAATGRKLVVDRLSKFRRYLARKAGIGKLKNLGEAETICIEEFASVIAEIQGRKGSRK
ncbi:hypothetical protein HQ563_18305 [bacterium]|nr:hypothetical protein [bacterium]